MRLFAALLAAASLAPVLAQAQASPVVLELYTSQGCSSCPPADALFADLARRDDVIALALHVDYWDYLGWRDDFARPRHTARQKAYAKAARSRTIFTPEMIIQGEDRLKGHAAAAIVADIAARLREPAGAALAVTREGDTIRIDVAPAGGDLGPVALGGTAGSVGAPEATGAPATAKAAPPAPADGAASFAAASGPGASPGPSPGPASGPASGPADIHVVRYIPEQEVAIGGGENAGQTLTYRNIVTDWKTIGQWDGRTPADFVVPDAGGGPVAVIVQQARMGPILAAARLP